jgi:amino acid permease
MLLAISSLAGMINWALICLSQIMFRKKYVQSGGKIEDLKFKMFGFPYVSYIGFILNTAMILSFVFLPGNLSMLFVFVPLFAVCWIGYDIYYKKRKSNILTD